MKIVVAVGTDHHPFDRLVQWFNYNALEHDVFVQWGTSTKSTRQGANLLPYPEMMMKFFQADLVVCHGGPSTIMDALAKGKNPIVIPRNPEYGEHVDNHQMLFVDFMADKNIIYPASIDNLHEYIESPPKPFIAEKSVPQGVANFGVIANSLILDS